MLILVAIQDSKRIPLRNSSVMNSKEGNRSASGQGGQDDDAGEDEESSSSSSSNTFHGQGERSKNYRTEQNRREAEEEAVDDEEDDEGDVEVAAKAAKTSDPETEQKARELFLEGVALEQDGKMFDAILKYKKAVHLVPDIEKRAFAFTQTNINSGGKEQSPEFQSEQDGLDNEDTEQDMEVDSATDMVARLFRLSISNGVLCLPATPNKTTHISSLPFEVLITIMKWVVSSDLDLRSLEQCSEVCRGFYLASRSNDVWKPVCLRTWGFEKIPNDIELTRKKNGNVLSWRQFYLTRPRVQLHGCYIARMSYLRQGERGFQDSEFYRSWHVVQYYRLIRFFAGGRLAMVTTSEEPSVAVKGLNNRYSSPIQGVMFGTYRTVDNRLVCMVRKNADKVFNNNNQNRFRRRKANQTNYVFEVPEQDFLFELELSGRRYQRLHWKSYTVVSRYLSGAGPEQRSEFDVNNQSTFPLLHFSPVKSYITETQASLD